MSPSDDPERTDLADAPASPGRGGLRSTRVDGVDVRWAAYGEGREGPPLVLVHGISESHRTWAGIAPRLARARRVIAIDLPLTGGRGEPSHPHTLAWHARLLDGLLERIGVPLADVVGHSYGGGVAQWLLLENRARVRRLALVSSGGFGREVTPWLRLMSVPRVFELLAGPAFALGARVAGSTGTARGAVWREWLRHNGQPGAVTTLHRTVRDVMDLRGQTKGFFDHAHEVEVLPPIRLFWGDRDRIVPVRHGEAAAAALDACELVRFEGVGHFPQREAPRALARALAAFFDADALPPSALRSRTEQLGAMMS